MQLKKRHASGAIRVAIRHRFLRSVLTYRSTLRSVLGTGGASHHGSDSIRHGFTRLVSERCVRPLTERSVLLCRCAVLIDRPSDTEALGQLA